MIVIQQVKKVFFNAINIFVRLIFLFFFFASFTFSQITTQSGSVTYISLGNVYVSRPENVQCNEGDTLFVLRDNSTIAHIIISVASSKSVVGKFFPDSATIKIGDTVRGFQMTTKSVSSKRQKERTTNILSEQRNNIVRGRIALQNISVNNFNLSERSFHQSGIVLNLNVQRVFGSLWNFSMYFNSQYISSSQKLRLGNTSRTRFRLFDFSFDYPNTSEGFAYSFGRVRSKYTVGLGAFDGAQIIYSMKEWTFGIAGGTQPDYRTSRIATEYVRFSPFIHFQSGNVFGFQYDGTVAYTRQMFQLRLDREFLYMQNSFSTSQWFNFYHSTEIDLNDIKNGLRQKAIQFTNTYISIGSSPLDWLSLNAGFDATKNVYLFETHRSLADSLFDRSLQQGFRMSMTIRLPNNFSLNGFSNIRFRESDERTSVNNGIGIRANNILNSRFNVGVRSSLLNGIFTDAATAGIDIHREIASGIQATINFEQYFYELMNGGNTNTLTTIGANVSGQLSSTLFTIASLEKNFDKFANTMRVFLEIGYRF